MSEEMTEKQAEEILRQFSQGKDTIHTFFRDIVMADSTTKTGNLNEEELGSSKFPVRTYKELELFCDDIYGDESWANYFKKMSEIQTSTSLSKDGMLIKLSVTSKKELADVTPSKKKNKGWFKSKKSGE
jgi:hypothetical protein